MRSPWRGRRPRPSVMGRTLVVLILWALVPKICKALSLDLSLSLDSLSLSHHITPHLVKVPEERGCRLLMKSRHGHLQDQKQLGSRLGSLVR